MNAGKGFRRRSVNVPDAGVGMRASEQRRVEHPPPLEVVGEDRAAQGQLDRVHLRLRPADHTAPLGLRRGDDQRPAGAGLDGRAAAIRQILAMRVIEESGGNGDRPLQRHERLHLLAAHDGRRPQHGLHRLDIPGLAIQHARQRLADFGLGRVRVLVQQRLSHQNLGRRVIARLNRAGLDECLLERMQPVRRPQALDSGDLMTVCLGGQEHHAVDRLAIQQHGRRATQALLVAKPDTSVPGAAQHVEQPFPGANPEDFFLAVDRQCNVHRHLPVLAVPLHPATRAWHTSSARRVMTPAIARR